MPSYDFAVRRRAVRKGRERGCWVYVPGEELAKVGRLDPEAPPLYRVWAGRSGSVVVTFYKAPEEVVENGEPQVSRA